MSNSIEKALEHQRPVIFEDVFLTESEKYRIDARPLQTWTVTINLYWLNHGDSAYVTLPRIDGDINKHRALSDAVETFLIKKGHFKKGAIR